MAELPRFQRSVGVPNSIGGQGISARNTPAGRAAVALGTAAQGANDFAGELDRIQETKESAWVTRATGEADIASSEIENRLEAESEEGAVGHVENYRTEFAGLKEEWMKSAPSSRAREALGMRLGQIEVGATKRRGSFQANSELAKRGTDFDSGMQSTMFSARQNPTQLMQLLGRANDDINTAASTWLPALDIPGVKQKSLGGLVQQATLGMIDNKDFVGARLYVEGETGELLDVGTRATLLNAIEEGEVNQFVNTEAVSISGQMTAAAGSSVDFASLAAAVVKRESGGNAKALSEKGASGLMQLMPGTAQEMATRLGVDYSPEMLEDPAYNKALGEEYLSIQLNTYDGNIVLALAAYNAGPGRADEWIEKFGDPRTGAITTSEFASKIPFKETREYVADILANLGASTLSPDEIMSERLAQIDDPAVRQRVARTATAEFALGDAARQKTAASQKMKVEENAARLEIAVDRNEASYADIEDAFARGEISAAKLVQLTKAKDNVVASMQGDTKDLRAAQARLGGDGGWNVYTQDDRKAVDLLYENSDQTPEAAIALVAATGIAPEAVVSDLRLRMQQGDADAFELADNIMAIAPTALDRSGGGQIASSVDEFRGYTRIGYSKDEATKRASRSAEERATLTSAGPDVTKEIREISKDNILDFLAVDGPFSDLDINDSRVGRLQSDFETAYREARNDGVAAGDASAVAAARLDRIWGLSSVSGKEEVMRYPPENYYPAGVDGHAYIREQVLADIEGLTGPGADDIRLVSSIITEGDIRAGQPPRYQVFYLDGSGFRQQLPGYFRADPEAATAALTDERKAAFAEKAAQSESARTAFAMTQEPPNLMRRSGNDLPEGFQ